MFRIITESGELDTYKELDVQFKYQLDDIIDISKRKTSYSKTIVLPGTPTNNKFFEQIAYTNVDKRINVKKRIRCSVRNGNNIILNGYLQLLDIHDTQGEIEYEVSVSQNTRNLWDDMGGYTLGDLDFSKYNHIRNKDSIINSWNYSIFEFGTEVSPELGKGYVYPSIVYGDNIDDVNSLSYVGDNYPAIFVKEIWDTMFTFLNHKYKSQFLDSEYFRRLIMPFVSDKLELSDEEISKRELTVGVKENHGDSFSYGFYNNWFVPNSAWMKRKYGWGNAQRIKLYDKSGPYGDKDFNDESNQWNTAQTLAFVADKSGYYDLSFNLRCYMQGRSPNGAAIRWADNDELKYTYKMVINRVNGTVDEKKPLDQNGNFTSTDWAPNDSDWRSWVGGAPPIFNLEGEDFFIDDSWDNIHLEPGDVVRVFVYLYTPNSRIFNTQNSSQGDNCDVRLLIAREIDSSFSTFTVTLADTSTPPNEEIDMNNVLDSKLKMQDFYKSIVDMFNLLIIEDPTEEGTLLIEPRQNFYRSRQRVKDWNNIIDIAGGVKKTPMSELDAKEYLFTYKSDSDYLNKEYNESYGRLYGDLTVETFDEFATNDKKIELSFSPTPNSTSLTRDRNMPYFIEKDGSDYKSKKVKPRILFFGGTLECSSYYLIDFDGDANGYEMNTYGYAGSWDHPINPRWDLNFGKTNTVYFNTDKYPLNNLYQMFYKEYVENILDLNNEILEANFKLSSKDIHDFDFRDIIYLKGSYWRTVEIKNYNPISSEKTTTVKLIKILNYETYDEISNDVPASNGSCPVDVGMIRTRGAWIYHSPSQPISEGCCSQLGGSWNNGVCTMRSATTQNPIGLSSGKDYGDSKPGSTGVLNPYNGRDTGVRVSRTSDYNTSPTIQPYGPDTEKHNYNSIHNTSTIVKGKNNYIDYDAKNSIVIGDDNMIFDNIKNVLVIGDNVDVSQGNDSIYLNNVVINENGEVNSLVDKPFILDGGLDSVMGIRKLNDIDILDGGLDSVRNFGGDKKNRPIIDGGIDNNV